MIPIFESLFWTTPQSLISQDHKIQVLMMDGRSSTKIALQFGAPSHSGIYILYKRELIFS